MKVSAGDRIGPYEILGTLGVGGMGEVYRARDEKLGRDVALKILPRDLAANTDALRRFEQEARAASALNHPNIVTIYEVSRTDDRAWIAMELVDGEDLRTLIERDPPTLKSALRIAVKVAEGISAAHERGIVHRDLKPENVMISRDGFVKILDFGLAKQMRILSSNDTTVPHTTPGAVFGTVGYMSPEQAKGKEMDYRSDQFSLGVILYELLTRVRPFERESKPETMTAIIRDDPPPPSDVNEQVPRELDRIVARCLAKHARERYGSTRDLAHDLREVRDGLTHPSYRSARSGPPFSPPAALRKRRTWTIAASALLVIALGAGGAKMWSRSRDAERIRAIAVMPFRDLTNSAEGRMLADGISEMIATRLSDVRELRVTPPYEGVPIAETDDVRAAARRKRVQAVIRGSVQRGGDAVRVTYALVDGASGDTLLSASATRPASELFALEDAIADDLARTLGRVTPKRPQPAAAALSAEDQRRFVEAVGLLQRVKDEDSVSRAITTLESILGNARESGAVNALLARALLYKASLARRPALIEQATVYASRGVTLSTNDPEAHVTLGELHRMSNRYTDALASFERALQLRPDHVKAITGVAEAYVGLGRAADAETMYRKAIALRPDVGSTYMKYGGFCYRNGRYEEAAQHFRKSTELTPDFSHAHANLGAALQALGRHDEALAAYEKSLAIQPTAAGYSNLGTLQFYLGRYDRAEEAYEQAALLAPSDYVLWLNLGDARRWAGGGRLGANDAYTRALTHARQHVSATPGDAYARGIVATLLAKIGKGDEAQKEIRRALESDPTNPRILYHASVVATLRGNHDGGVSWLERAIAAGYPAEDAVRDPELAAIRELPSFRSAVKSTQ
ncbi:MAG TPA: protein kinase [Thermoanaerobaculia bacterium]|nr:protein kinase [Thermoanaerobaculia bacterium]